MVEAADITQENAVFRWELASRDPLRFLEWFCMTCDQHDQVTPIKPFPVDRPHIYHLTRLWQHNRLLAIVKSRQMMMTWLFSALCLWDAMFHPGRLIMLQSKREEDAVGDENVGDGLLGRIKFILNHMPAVPNMPRYEKIGNRVRFTDNNSTLWAIPQGAAIVRQRTASGIFSDEAGYQDEFGDAYVAARPCIRGGGWFLALSTANPGFFQRLCEDTVSGSDF